FVIVGETVAYPIRQALLLRRGPRLFKLGLGDVGGKHADAVPFGDMASRRPDPAARFDHALFGSKPCSTSHVILQANLCRGQRFMGNGKQPHVQVAAPDRGEKSGKLRVIDLPVRVAVSGDIRLSVHSTVHSIDFTGIVPARAASSAKTLLSPSRA